MKLLESMMCLRFSSAPHEELVIFFTLFGTKITLDKA